MKNELFQPLDSTREEPFPKLLSEYTGSTYWRDVWLRLKASRSGSIGASILLLLFLLAAIGPSLTPYSFYEVHLDSKNLPPSRKFWFGTDELGRDLFTRVWWGARISLFIGIAASLVDLAVGVLYGSIAAMFGGKVDEMMMRFCDILHSIPSLLFVILLMVMMEPNLFTILLALTLTGWIGMARIIRGQILQLKTLDFIKAAEAMGASRARILFRHFIPNVIGPIIATVTLTIPVAIFAEAILSFLGLGVQAPIASWGTMASDGLTAMRYYPWRLFFPALFISITMLSFNLLGEGLRDAFDPRIEK